MRKGIRPITWRSSVSGASGWTAADDPGWMDTVRGVTRFQEVTLEGGRGGGRGRERGRQREGVGRRQRGEKKRERGGGGKGEREREKGNGEGENVWGG